MPSAGLGSVPARCVSGGMIPLDPVPHPIDTLPSRGRAGDIALIDRAGAIDFAALEALTGAVASWLARQGFAAGSRVASWLPKTRLACVLPMAAPRAGLVHVPINPVLKRAQVAHILADSGASLLVTQAARAARWRPAMCRTLAASWCRRRSTLDGDVMPPSSADPAALAAILYTSGSTGRPKGVMLSHANLWLGAISVAHYLKLTPADRVLGVLPLSFDYGQNQLFSTWAAGASVVPIDYLTARDVIKAVERFEATTLAGVPPLWVQLLEAEWPAETAARLKRLTNSGGALTPRMIRGPAPALSRGRSVSDVRADRGVPVDLSRSVAGRCPSRRDRPGDTLCRGDGGPCRRNARRSGRAGRTRPCRAAGRAGLLAGCRADRAAVPSGARLVAAWRHGGMVGRHGGRRAPMGCCASSGATTR